MNDLLKSALIINTIKDYKLLKELCKNKNINIKNLYSDDHVKNVGLGKIIIQFKKSSLYTYADCWVHMNKKEAKDEIEEKKFKQITIEEFRYL